MRKSFLLSENVKKRRKSVYGAKTSLAKAKTRLPSKNVARKVVYAFIEGKRGTENRKRVYHSSVYPFERKHLYPAKTWLAKAQTR